MLRNTNAVPFHPIPSRAACAFARGAANATVSTLLAIALLAGSGCYNDVESRLAEIRVLQASGKFEESLEHLRVLIAADPENPEANYRLGAALVQTGRASLAVWPLKKASRTQAFGVQAGLLLSSTLLATDSYEEAIRAANDVLAKDPNRPNALYNRARAQIGVGRAELALQDVELLLEIQPDDPIAYTIKTGALIDLERFEEAEQSHIDFKRVAEAGASAERAARACGGLAMFYKGREQLDKADEVFEQCLETYPDHAVLRNWATAFYAETGQFAKAEALWRGAIDANPEDMAPRATLSKVLVSQGKNDEAEKVLEEAAELFDTGTAWQALASIYRKNGKTPQARKALEQALERARREPEGLRFALADMLIEEGELDRAQEIANGMKEASYRALLNGAILLARDEPRAALAQLEAGLRLWPNNTRARYMAGRTAEALGDNKRAVQEYREALRISETETSAALDLARLYYQEGQYSNAQQFAQRYIQNHPLEGSIAHVIAARAAFAQGQLDAAKAALDALSGDPRFRAVAVAEYAKIVGDTEGAAAAAAWIEKSNLDLSIPANHPALRALVSHLVAAGRAREALQHVDRALAQRPDDALDLELRGRVLMQLERRGEAEASIARALEIDPGLASAIEVLGNFASLDGDLEGALREFDRAAAADPDNASYSYQAARVSRMLGRNDDALSRLREAVEREPGHVAACNDLAWELAERGEELDFALMLATRAAQSKRNAATLDTLGWVLLKKGDTDAAIRSFRSALELEPNAPSTRYRLGLALVEKGEAAEARSQIESALAGGSFPERDAARAELARLQGS
ncbi:MAG: tetratricopeptide repeat protein [Deltaproteobacteria bacterium]|nr:tetratricopeptide repeat protein [Deltaproteobacteria bacterium]MBW2420302.1 tetratricopeptide repeat protein [Deltaproteobacteria bacterium]